MRKSLAVISLFFALINFSGCSIFMAAKQPDKKDTSVLNAGISRDSIIAEFGMPVGAEVVNGDKVEIYKYIQGYNKGTKISRAVFHGLADFATLFIWELVAMPIEAVANGTKKSVKVTYDSQDRVKDVDYLQA